MEKELQKLRESGYKVVSGQNGRTMVDLPEKVVNHHRNKNKGLKEGLAYLADCAPACKPADEHGYELCIGGNCVYFPIG